MSAARDEIDEAIAYLDEKLRRLDGEEIAGNISTLIRQIDEYRATEEALRQWHGLRARALLCGTEDWPTPSPKA